jgi:hypothetical protein
MNIEQKISFVFNRLLIDFFKDIKKDNYFKLAIKKNYKVIDKRSPQYIKAFIKKTSTEEFHKFFTDNEIDLSNLEKYNELFELNILKNIKINRLLNNFKDDKENVLSYVFMLYLFGYLFRIFREEVVEYNEELEKKQQEDEVENQDDNEEDDKVLEEQAKNQDDEEEEDEDEEEEEEEEEDGLEEIYLEQNNMLHSIISILEKINKKEDIQSEVNEIIDDDIKSILNNINRLKVTVKFDNGIEDLIGDSKIGNLAKDISDSIDISQLNIENASDLLDPSKLFSGEGGNILGNLVQQVGSSITDKINSGELKQDELVKDAFSLMNKMQSGAQTNPILGDMFNNMMGGGNSEGGGMPDMSSFMQNMMNPDMMQQMMNSMGGTQGLNQNNPNSRESKMREKLRKKLDEKKE